MRKTLAAAVDNKIAQAETKVPFSYIPLRALKGVARIFAYGRKKYAAGNFYLATLEDGAAERYLSAMLRHLSDCQKPDGTWDVQSLGKLDAESGLPEYDHILSGLLMLRAIMTKDGVLPEDPGPGKEPIK